MKRTLTIIAALSLFALGATASVALADKPPAPPGKDPCSHGNTGKECKPDPQPDRGKDCEKHGKEGGVNEDHCKGETQPPTTPTETTPTTPTTTTPTTTTPTQTTPQTTTPAQTTPTQTTPTPTTPTTTTPTATPAVPVVTPPVVTPTELEEELKEQEKKNGAPGAPTARAQTPGELPNTGLPLGLVALLGGLLTATGWRLRRS